MKKHDKMSKSNVKKWKSLIRWVKVILKKWKSMRTCVIVWKLRGIMEIKLWYKRKVCGMVKFNGTPEKKNGQLQWDRGSSNLYS